MQMALSLSRKAGESILIGEDIEVTVIEVRGKVVRIDVTAPQEVKIMRRELVERDREEQR
jgi:carbon storage regulator